MKAVKRAEFIQKHGLTIGIDGPAGSGKSTVSRRVAVELAIGYLDTGAMYRALTWYALERGISLEDQASVAAAAREMPLVMHNDPLAPSYFVGDVDVTAAIREPRVSEAVSLVSTNLEVRAWMRVEQRRRMLEAKEQGSGMIAEGRDITTVVYPDADLRILLLADPEARLRRRTMEIYGVITDELLDKTRQHVQVRDAKDATVAEFIRPAPGVETVDSSGLSIDEVVGEVISLVDRYFENLPTEEM